MIAQLKRIAKYLAAVAMYYSGILAIITYLKGKFSGEARPLILMYHRIIDETTDKDSLQPGLYVNNKVFEKQIEFLAKTYKPISMREFDNSIKNNNLLPRKSVLITFDDGWRDNFIHAYPILNKYGVSATIFLAVDFIGSGRIFWFYEISSILANPAITRDMLKSVLTNSLGKLPDSKSAQNLLADDLDFIIQDKDSLIEKLKSVEISIIYDIIGKLKNAASSAPARAEEDRLMLNWDEVKEMSKAHIEFGSHGMSHRLLTIIELNEVNEELHKSKKIIEEKIEKPIISFSYPNGNHNEEIEKAVEKAGYQYAFIVGNENSGIKVKNIFALGRVGIHNDISIGPLGKFSRAMFSLHLSRFE